MPIITKHGHTSIKVQLYQYLNIVYLRQTDSTGYKGLLKIYTSEFLCGELNQKNSKIVPIYQNIYVLT